MNSWKSERILINPREYGRIWENTKKYTRIGSIWENPKKSGRMQINLGDNNLRKTPRESEKMKKVRKNTKIQQDPKESE